MIRKEINSDFISMESTRTKKGLKPKEFQFLEEYINNGGSGPNAVAVVFGFDLNEPKQYSKAAHKARNLLKRLKPTIDEELEAKGITKSKIATVISDGLQASRTKIVNNEEIIIPDHKSRHLFLETTCKLKNLFPNKSEIDVNMNGNAGVLVVPGIFGNKDEWLQGLQEVRKVMDDLKNSE